MNFLFKKIYKRIRRGVVSLKTSSNKKGTVLLSYITTPFLYSNTTSDHTNILECKMMANVFLDLGYNVDVIDWTNSKFIPKKKYSFFIDIHSNLERLSSVLNNDCKKVLHLTGSHWLTQNMAEYSRLLDLKNRRGVVLKPRRIVSSTNSIEEADFVTMLGNSNTKKTFSYADKDIYNLNLATSTSFKSPKDKDFETIRNNFLWIGGSGMVHKGLDRVLETFVSLPEHNLFICGPVDAEKDFAKEYYNELYNTKNIKTLGWMDVDSEEFNKVVNNCIGMVYPSCSEGQAGSVVVSMQAGLIPIVSKESGVDVNDFGYILNDCSLSEIKEKVTNVSKLSLDELRNKSVTSWDYARENHNPNKFKKDYTDFIRNILKA